MAKVARVYNPEGLGFCVLDFGTFPNKQIDEFRYVLDTSGSMGVNSTKITEMFGELLCEQAFEGVVHEYLFSDTVKEFRKSAKDLKLAQDEFCGGGTLFKPTLDKLRRSHDHTPIVIITDGAVSDDHRIEFSESGANFPVVMLRFGDQGATSFFEKVSRCLTFKAPDVVNMTVSNMKEKIGEVVDHIIYEKADLKIELTGCKGRVYFGDQWMPEVHSERFCIVDKVPAGCVVTHKGVKSNVEFEYFPHVDPDGMLPWIADVQKQLVRALAAKLPVDLSACVAEMTHMCKFLKSPATPLLSLTEIVSRACTSSLADKIKSCTNCVQQINTYLQQASVLDSNEMGLIMAISAKDFRGFDLTAKKDKGFLKRYADELSLPKKTDDFVKTFTSMAAQSDANCLISCLSEQELSAGAALECVKLGKVLSLQEMFTAVGVVGFSAACSVPQNFYPAPEMFADEVDRFGEIDFYGYTLATSVFSLMQRDGHEFRPPGEDQVITMVVPVLESENDALKKSYLQKFGNAMCSKYTTGIMADIPDMGVFFYFQCVRSLFDKRSVFENTLFKKMLLTFKWFAFHNSSLLKGHAKGHAAEEPSVSVALVSAAAQGKLTCAHLAGVQNASVFYAGILALDAPPCESLGRHLYVLEAYFAHKYAKIPLTLDELIGTYETCIERHDEWALDIVNFSRFSKNMALLQQPSAFNPEFVFAATLFAVLCGGEQKKLVAIKFDAAKPELFNLQQISAFKLEKQRVAQNKAAKTAAHQHFAEHVLRAAHSVDREEIKALLLAACTDYTTKRFDGADTTSLTPTPSLLLQPFVLPEEFVMPVDLREDWHRALIMDSADPLLAFASALVQYGPCPFFSIVVQLDGPKSLTPARYDKFQLLVTMGPSVAQKLQTLVYKLNHGERAQPNRHGWGKSNVKPEILPRDFVMCDAVSVGGRHFKQGASDALQIKIDQARMNVELARKKVGVKMLPKLDAVIYRMALDESYFLGPVFKTLVEACEKLVAVDSKLPARFRDHFESDLLRLKFCRKSYVETADYWCKKI